MKLIDLTPVAKTTTSVTKFTSQARKLVEETFSIRSDEEAQEVLITQLGRILSNQYTLIRNAQVEGLDAPVPLILIGPTGLSVIHASSIKGIFQAKGEILAEMGHNRQFQPARPNLIAQTQMMAEAVDSYLAKNGYTVPEIPGILFFSHPGTHVDSIRPSVRIVLMDGVERFITGLLQGHPVLTKTDAQNYIEALTRPPEIPENGQEAATKTTIKNPLVNPELENQITIFSQKVPFSAQQIILLGAMAIIEIIVLIGFIALILSTH